MSDVAESELLNAISNLRRRHQGASEDEVKRLVRHTYDNFDYLPLSPYYDINQIFPYLMKKSKNPLELMKRLIVYVLNRAYDDELERFLSKDIVENVRLIRWGAHALSTMLVHYGKDILIFANILKKSVETQNIRLAKNIIKDPAYSGKLFKKHKYKDASFLVNVLTSLNFAISDINLDKILGISSQQRNAPKKYIPSLQSILLASTHQIRDLPAKNVSRKLAELIADVGIETRRLIVRKYRKGAVSHIEVAREAQEYVKARISDIIESVSLRNKLITLSGVGILSDAIFTPIYMYHYGLKEFDIIESIVKFKF